MLAGVQRSRFYLTLVVLMILSTMRPCGGRNANNVSQRLWMKQYRKWLLLGVGLVIVLLVDFPIITVALNSFRTTETIISSHSILPTQPTLANYLYINTRTRFWTFLINSGIVAASSTLLGIVLASLAGFAMSRYRAGF